MNTNIGCEDLRNDQKLYLEFLRINKSNLQNQKKTHSINSYPYFPEQLGENVLKSMVERCLALDMIIPGSIEHIIFMMKASSNGASVAEVFLDKKQIVVLNKLYVRLFRKFFERFRNDEYDQKDLFLDCDIKYKIIDISSAYAYFSQDNRLVNIFLLYEGDSLKEFYYMLVSEFLVCLTRYFHVNIDKAREVADKGKINIFSLYKLYWARNYIRNRCPSRVPYLEVVIRSSLEDNFWKVIEDVSQEGLGKKIALHNQEIREQIDFIGLNCERWIGKNDSSRMGELSYKIQTFENSFTVQVEPVKRDPGLDLFIGDEVYSQFGMGSQFFPSVMVHRLIDQSINLIKMTDLVTGKVIALVWLYLSKDGDLVAQDFEVSPQFKKESASDQVIHYLIDYTCQYAEFIGAKRFLIGVPFLGELFKKNGYIERYYKESVIGYKVEKLGAYLEDKKYSLLSSAGKKSCYLIWEEDH